MPRSTDVWTGRTDDSTAPPRVRQRIFDRDGGKCHFCGQPIQTGQKWALDHIKALINGGENTEANLAPIHVKPCHQVKTAADVAIKAKVAAVRQKHIGVAEKKRPIQSVPFPKTEKSPRIDKSALPAQPRRSMFTRIQP